MIIVNATLPAKEDKKDEVIEQAKPLIEASRTHEGNISYNLYRDVLDDSLIFIEKWESQEALQAHMQTPEFIEFGKNIQDLVAGPLGIKIIVGEEIEGE
jgi:quinol monooxygenase YgiN